MRRLREYPIHRKKGSQPRLAALGSPFQGKVPRRGGGWMGEAVSPTQSLPRVGNAVKLSKILIAHASNSVCFFHALSLPVNNKIKKLVK